MQGYHFESGIPILRVGIDEFGYGISSFTGIKIWPNKNGITNYYYSLYFKL